MSRPGDREPAATPGGGGQPPTSGKERIRALIDADAEVRAATVELEDLSFIREGRCAIELIERACRRYADRPSLGSRTAVTEGYRTWSYAQLWTTVEELARGWSGCISEGDTVGICGYASPDWVAVDIACLYLGAVSVPLQGTLSVLEQVHVVSEARLSCVAVSADRAAAMAEVLARCPSVSRVVVIDGDDAATDAAVTLLRSALPECVIDGLAALRARGRPRPALPFVVPDPDASPLFSVVYTSGSTGMPKGVMLPETRWHATLRDALAFTEPFPFLSLGYLPLSHMAGRINVYLAMMLGGCTRFVTRSDMSTLFDDVRQARPTHLVMVPRLSMMLHQKFQAELVRRGIDYSPEILDDPRVEPILGELREHTMGGRLVFVATGSAPTAPEVSRFIERCLRLPLVDSYGSTEVARITVNGRVQAGVSYKLVDAPELGYTRADEPHPRGELAVKSSRVTPGYFNNPEATRAMFDEDGYFLTGDIVEEVGPGHLRWLDRRNNVLRLAQGEFVNTSQLEELYAASSPFVRQVYVYGSSVRAYLLAVIVPDAAALGAALGVAEPDHDDHAEKVRGLIRSALDQAARRAELPGHESIRDFVLDWQPFSRENGLLTDANKPRRLQLKRKYGDPLEELYERIESRRLRALQDEMKAGRATTLERAGAAMALVLGVDRGDMAAGGRSFVEMGGDSLGAVRLAELVQELYGVTIPASFLLSRSTSAAELAAEIERQGSSGPDADLAATSPWIEAGAFDVHEWLTMAELANVQKTMPVAPPRRILLTGASGFLGHFVAAALIDALPPTDCEVVALVREQDDAAARRRLAQRFMDSGLGPLDPRVTVYAGDLMAEGFGISAPVYQRLIAEMDAVVHCGALVNHALAYPHLRAPNVAGTAEAMRLAVRGRAKSLHFVSTTGIAAGSGHELIRESLSAADLWARRRTDDTGYAMGYATSKWAGECLLDSLHAATGVPVRIYRCGMILPHTQLSTGINDGDTFCRLLYGMLRTRVAPESFYAPDYRSERHYDGLPVDLVAGFIAASVLAGPKGRAVYHVSNSNWSAGVSLDTVVDAALAAGYPLERLPYEAWYQAFRRRLEALSPAEQKRSPLPIIERWRQPTREGKGVLKMDTEGFAAALQTALGVEGIPILSEAYLRHCLAAVDGLP